jgi:hypothetical protein
MLPMLKRLGGTCTCTAVLVGRILLEARTNMEALYMAVYSVEKYVSESLANVWCEL